MKSEPFAIGSSDPAPANGYIQHTPGVCGGKACIAGTRIRVQDMVLAAVDGAMSVEDLQREYPQLRPAQIHAALAYFFDHADQIRREIAESEDLATALRAESGSPLEEKLARLRGKDAANNPISSR